VGAEVVAGFAPNENPPLLVAAVGAAVLACELVVVGTVGLAPNEKPLATAGVVVVG
jgi:hypothetical protein